MRRAPDEKIGGAVGAPNGSVHSSTPFASIMRSDTSPPGRREDWLRRWGQFFTGSSVRYVDG